MNAVFLMQRTLRNAKFDALRWQTNSPVLSLAAASPTEIVTRNAPKLKQAGWSSLQIQTELKRLQQLQKRQTHVGTPVAKRKMDAQRF